ncbi:MAG: ribosome-associated translation inhibitor RaiA [Candidatus Harrisonbacteria bacterium]|nr:ribosome-associated translation inhibitor RaiA [Candidatus Harrisonbacteria bacterium]
MKIIVRATNIELTEPLKEYINMRIEPLSKFLGKMDLEGAVEAQVEVGRMTHHHHKGDVFRAEVNLHLPKKSLRAESETYDARVAIDNVRDTLAREIKEYKERISEMA